MATDAPRQIGPCPVHTAATPGCPFCEQRTEVAHLRPHVVNPYESGPSGVDVRKERSRRLLRQFARSRQRRSEAMTPDEQAARLQALSEGCSWFD